MSDDHRQTYSRAREETKRIERATTLRDLENTITRLVATVASMHVTIHGDRGLIAQVGTAQAANRQLDARIKLLEQP